MWLGKSKVKMKTVTNRVLNILRFLFTVNAELLISKFSSVLNWFINIILHSDIWQRCLAFKYQFSYRIVLKLESALCGLYSYNNVRWYFIIIIMHVCWYFFIICRYFNIINWNLNTMWYVTLACRYMYIWIYKHFMAILHYLYWYFITICWYFSLYAD